MLYRMLLCILATGSITGVSQAATLGLTTSAPTIGATGSVNYFEFGPDADLSLLDGFATVSSLTSLDVPSSDVSFGVGFDAAHPEAGATGGFSVFDAQGLYLAGDLIDLGFRSFGLRSIVELHFGSLSGRGTPEWTETLLMNVIFDRAGDNPIAAFVDGDVFDVELGVFAVVGSPAPPPIPLPAAGWLLLGGLAALAIGRRLREVARC